MEIAIVTCLNDRPAISQIFMNTLRRIQYRDPTVLYRYYISGAFAAVSNQPDVELCLKYGITHVRADNNTAGYKWNHALNFALEKSTASHFLIMGDDDSISNQGIAALCKKAREGNTYVGFKDNYFVDTLSGKAHSHKQPYMAPKIIGAGALISRQAIEAACDLVQITLHMAIETPGKNYSPGKHTVSRSVAEYLSGYKGFASITEGKWRNLWPDKGNGLDHAREMRLVMAGHPPVAIEDGRIHLTDFKGGRNIWDYQSVVEKFRGPSCTPEDATWYMSESEKEYIHTLIHK